MNYKSLFYILKIAFGTSLIYWLLSSDKFDISVLSKLSNPLYIIILVVVYLVALFLNSTRWFLINKFYEIQTSWINCVKLYFVGMFFSFFLPAGNVGGDLVKGYYVIKNNKSQKIKSAMGILLDKYFALYTMIMAAFFVLLFVNNKELTNVFIFVCLLFLISNLALLLGFVRETLLEKFVNKYLSFIPKKEFLFTLHKCFSNVIFQPRLIFIVILMSCCSYLMYVTIFMISGIAMGFKIPVWIYMYAVPLSLMFSSIPISPGGIGVGQVAALGLFGLVSTESNLGPSTITAYQLSGIILGLIGLIIYIKLKD